MRSGLLKLFLASCSGLLLAGCVADVDVYEPVPAPVVNNTLEVKHLWSRSIGWGVGDYYSRLRPALDDERVYAASRDGDVYAFNKLTGEKLWHVDLEDGEENDERRTVGLSGGITIGDGVIYIAAENGYVYALKAADGTLLWKYNTGSEIVAAPACDYSQVYVMSSFGQLTAINSTTGERAWTGGTDSKMLALRGTSAPVVLNGGLVMYGTSDGKLNFVRADRGLMVKQVPVGNAHGTTRLARLNDVVTTPLVISNEIYITGLAGNLTGIVYPRFQNMWSRNYSSYQDLAYDLSDLALTDRNSHIHAIIRIDGSERWVNSALTYRSVTGPAYLGDYVIVGDYEGYLYWLDGADGRFVNKEKLDSSGIYTAPVVDGNIAYVVTRNGELWALTPKGSAADPDMNAEENSDEESAE